MSAGNVVKSVAAFVYSDNIGEEFVDEAVKIDLAVKSSLTKMTEQMSS